MAQAPSASTEKSAAPDKPSIKSQLRASTSTVTHVLASIVKRILLGPKRCVPVSTRAVQ